MHECLVCFTLIGRHGRCPLGCDHWEPFPCCPGCKCGSFEESHRGVILSAEQQEWVREFRETMEAAS